MPWPSWPCLLHGQDARAQGSRGAAESTVLLLGNGSGGFGPPQTITSNSGQLLKVADFNGDGLPDFLIGGSGNESIYLNGGNGTFTSPDPGGFSLVVPPPLTDIAVGDFNGDGIIDLAAVSDTLQNSLVVFLGKGNGTLQFPQVFDVSFDYYTMEIPALPIQLNGSTEILTFRQANFSNNQSGFSDVWSWTGNPGLFASFSLTESAFSSAPSFPSPYFAVVADFNADGVSDWAGVNLSSGTVTVALGVGGGTFNPAPGSPITVGGAPFAIAAADFNGDGKPDLAIDTGSSIVILLNTGTVSPQSQTIQFGTLAAQAYLNPPFAVSATTSSGLPVTFTSNFPSVCSVSGTTVTIVNAGTCSITASQAGNSTYGPATPVTQAFTVNQASQRIAFIAPSAQVLGINLTLTATASSGLPVTYAAQPSTVCAVSGSVLRFVGTGTCSVTASQSGSSDYTAAAPVTQSFPVTSSLSSQTITFNAIAPQGVGVTYTLGASASSGLPVTFTSNTSSICTVSGSQVTTITVGTCSITATQAGNSAYAAATPLTQTFTVSLSQQTITFNAPPSTVTVGATVPLIATSTSGLPITFTSNTHSICTVAGAQVSTLGLGICSITANQSGNSTWAAAAPVTQSFAVVSPSLMSQTITFDPLTNRTLGSGAFSLSATASSGLPVSFSSPTPATCSVSGNTVTLLAAGACSIVATQAGNSTYNTAPPVSQTFTIAAASLTPQTITFNPIPSTPLSAGSVTLTATASSGLPVSFSSNTLTVCTVSGDQGILITPGACTIVATQFGNNIYSAASVTQSFTVTPASTSTGPSIASVDNAASYAQGTLAPGSYADIFGTNLAASPNDPSVAVTITDARGNQTSATILYAGSTQVNILIPATVAFGPATLALSNSLGSVTSSITIGVIAPGLFTVDSAATIPAAQVVTTVNGTQTVTPVANCTTSGCTLVPIVLNPSTPSYLILYGTGIRGATNLADVSVTIGGVPATVQYAGPQGGYPGLDQVNALIPSTLAGQGQVSLTFSIFTTSANPVQLDFQ